MEHLEVGWVWSGSFRDATSFLWYSHLCIPYVGFICKLVSSWTTHLPHAAGGRLLFLRWLEKNTESGDNGTRAALPLVCTGTAVPVVKMVKRFPLVGKQLLSLIAASPLMVSPLLWSLQLLLGPQPFSGCLDLARKGSVPGVRGGLQNPTVASCLHLFWLVSALALLLTRSLENFSHIGSLLNQSLWLGKFYLLLSYTSEFTLWQWEEFFLMTLEQVWKCIGITWKTF